MAQRVRSFTDFDPFSPSKQTESTGASSSNNLQWPSGTYKANHNSQDQDTPERHRTRAKAFSFSSMANGGSVLFSHALRLNPGDELRKSLLNFVEAKHLKAAFILTCVGSSREAKIRLASATSGDTNYVLDLVGMHEIVSLTGTLSGGGHLHVSLADQSGKVRGGHLLELIVGTTAEIVIGECSSHVFRREPDERTGFKELVVSER